MYHSPIPSAGETRDPLAAELRERTPTQRRRGGLRLAAAGRGFLHHSGPVPSWPPEEKEARAVLDPHRRGECHGQAHGATQEPARSRPFLLAERQVSLPWRAAGAKSRLGRFLRERQTAPPSQGARLQSRARRAGPGEKATGPSGDLSPLREAILPDAGRLLVHARRAVPVRGELRLAFSEPSAPSPRAASTPVLEKNRLHRAPRRRPRGGRLHRQRPRPRARIRQKPSPGTPWKLAKAPASELPGTSTGPLHTRASRAPLGAHCHCTE